jgi:acyl-CoA thioesterase
MAAAVALGIEVVRDEPGRGTCRLTIAGEHLNQGLVAHGGVLFTLADTALGIAANPPGVPTWVGTGFSLQLFRALAVGDTVVADAREEHRSRRLVSYAVRLEREGALVGTMNAQLLAAREGGPERAPGAVTLEPADGALAAALLASAEREGMPAPPGELLVVLEDGRPVGCVVRPCFVWMHPAARGRGLDVADQL